MGEDGSVESHAEFEQFAQDAGLVDWLTDSAPGEAVPDEQPVDTGSADRPRNEKGQYVSTKEEPAEDSAEEPVPADAGIEAAAEPEPEEDDGDIVIEIDDDLQSVLDKYDGDVGKALKALADSQSMIGRQGNELGELRAELQQMRAMMQQGFQSIPQQQFLGPYQHDLEEDPKGLTYEALQRGDAQTMELALRAWGDEDPFEASSFLFALQQEALQAQQVPPQEQHPVAPQGVGGSLETAMADVVARHPDVERYLPGIGETAKEFPTLRNFMEQGTPAQKAQAFEELLVITKTRASQSDTSQAMKRVILKTQEEVQKEKAEAAVLSAKTQSAATAQESPLEAFYRQFEEATGQLSGADWITRSND